MATDYGTDISTFVNGGLDVNFGIISGPRVVAENVARRLVTRRGIIDDDPEYGTDFIGWINAVMSDTFSTETMAELIRNECRRDERVDDASVVVTQPIAGNFKAEIQLFLIENQQFRLVLSLSSLLQNVELLKS